MKYMLLIYSNEAGRQSASKAEAEQIMGAYSAYSEAMAKAGVMVMVGRYQLEAAVQSAHVVRRRTGRSDSFSGTCAKYAAASSARTSSADTCRGALIDSAATSLATKSIFVRAVSGG